MMKEDLIDVQAAGLVVFSRREVATLAVALGLPADATPRQIAEHAAKCQQAHVEAMDVIERSPMRTDRGGGIYRTVTL